VDVNDGQQAGSAGPIRRIQERKFPTASLLGVTTSFREDIFTAMDC